MASSNQTTLCLVLTEQLTKPLLCTLNTTYLLTLLPENLKRSIIKSSSSTAVEQYITPCNSLQKKLHQIHRTFVAAMSCMYVCTYMHFKNSFKTQTGMYTIYWLRNRRKMWFFTRSLLGQKRERGNDVDVYCST